MSLSEVAKQRFQERYSSPPEALAAAPGRVEFIGNHTDYNMGPVIGAAIDRGVVVSLKRNASGAWRFSSAESDVIELADPVQRQEGSASWVNYPLGVLHALKKRGMEAGDSFDLHVESDLPSGSGLSSSAALELATATAMKSAFGLELDKSEAAIACREAENEFVGVPCGILDQGVSAFGETGKLVHIDCRDMIFSTLSLGDDYSIWIFNTKKKHSLIDSMYSDRHKECFQAVDQLKAAGLKLDYLADVSGDQFERCKDQLEPIPARRAEHIIREIERVNDVQDLLAKGATSEVGKKLLESHASSRDLFENSIPELDYLVEILASMPSVLGARLTGGGFGGAAMALTDRTFTQAYAESVASAYRGRFGQEPEILHSVLSEGARLL